jgi:Domain of unknown function (DUF3854)
LKDETPRLPIEKPPSSIGGFSFVPLAATSERRHHGMDSSGHNIDVQDAVYSAVLNALWLWDWHRGKLRARGLSDEEIDRRQYRTDGLVSPERLLGQFDLATLLSVPGFILENGRLRLKMPSGIVIPVRDERGRLVALKVRLDHVWPGGPKYLYVTSKPHGPGPGAPVHVPFGIRGPCPILRWTEGEVKADISTDRNCTPTASFAGVPADCDKIIATSLALQAETLKFAFDSDSRKNPTVAADQLAVVERMRAEGFDVQLETWPLEWKGIDDLLVSGRTPDVHAGDAAIEMAREIAEAAGVDPKKPAKAARRASSDLRVDRPKGGAAESKSIDSAFDKALACVDCAAVVTAEIGPPTGSKWICPFDGCGGPMGVRLDRLGIGRTHCWQCGVDENAIGFLRRLSSYTLSFKAVCERLGLPNKQYPKDEGHEDQQDDAAEPSQVWDWLAESCIYRRKLIMLQDPQGGPAFAVFPPCGCRISCVACNELWKADQRARFRLGLDLIAEGAVFKAAIAPAEWDKHRKRIQRLANKAEAKLLYATLEFDDERGDRRLLVVSNVSGEKLARGETHHGVKRETASGSWCEAVKHAAIDIRNPASFSRDWPQEPGKMKFKRIGEIQAEPHHVHAVAPQWGFQVLSQTWKGDRLVCMVCGFSTDGERSKYQMWGFKAAVEAYRDGGELEAWKTWFFYQRVIGFACEGKQMFALSEFIPRENVSNRVTDNTSSGAFTVVAENKKGEQLSLFSEN